MKVLIVDDSGLNREILKGFLKEFNILDISTACDGKEALQLCKENDFDLVFMDIEMPIMNGYESTKAIKKIKNLKIIAVTSHFFEEIQQQFNYAGFDYYISKPVTINLLKYHLEKIKECEKCS